MFDGVFDQRLEEERRNLSDGAIRIDAERHPITKPNPLDLQVVPHHLQFTLEGDQQLVPVVERGVKE